MAAAQGRRMSLANKVLIGLALGIAVGIFFGEQVAFLSVVGRAFILLLQMPVLPYIVVSLVLGLGRLDVGNALAIARSGGAVMLVLWGIVMAVVLVFPLSFPAWESASFFSRALVETPATIDILGLYIPANPFASLAQTVVPAIVVFSVALGVALIGIKKKDALLQTLETMQDALARITGAVVQLAPVGVFCLMASAAGTLDPSELGRIQVYTLVYAAVSLLLVFYVLPFLVTGLTPLRYRMFIGPARDALLTSFATGNLLIVLPILAHEAKEMLRREGVDQRTADSAVDVLVPASFTFPNMGKLLSLAFVPFAGWFTGFEMSLNQYPLFAAAGLVSFFGEPIVSLPFLLNLLRIPSDTFQLFVTVDVITSRFGTLLAAAHTLVLAVLGAFVMGGKVRFSARRLMAPMVLGVVLLVVVLGGTRLFFTHVAGASYTKYREFVELELLYDPAPVVVHEDPSSLAPGGAAPGRRLAHIRERGSLRVAYFRDALPFAFRNAHADIVGYDVEMAHLLARELGVQLELVRTERGTVTEALQAGTCDIAMSGFAITPDWATKVRYSVSAGELTVAFVVPDHDRQAFASWETLQKRRELVLALGSSGYYERLLREMLPKAQVVTVGSAREYFRGESEPADALATAAEVGAAWSLVYPQFSVVVPQPDPIALPLAYPMPRGEDELADFVDAFVALKMKDGTTRALSEHWFEGKHRRGKAKRWSVVRNVLGWGS
jgi:Na+/H+-dicarboxylate symporter/ABC-type amino acid transport substrate-binding protein